ncbi:hypothetical protein FHS27_001983 [Rhodopirellula rubra]|uniref:Uncharacterized protein n=1 Tax=Aporhodopirellula rubra TaxID=980271 RepID=A0A7W5DX54_9BACT|nr:hypothetical protein [Aporhodopirellula rubra]MBB3206175.1 hypothetical protein [Aporhodopirellula rubra]
MFATQIVIDDAMAQNLFQPIVSEAAEPRSSPLLQDGEVSPIFVDSRDHAGALRAASDPQADIEHANGVEANLSTDRKPSGKLAVIVGTLGRSNSIDLLVEFGKFNVEAATR